MPNGIDVGDAAGDLQSAKAEANQTLSEAQSTGAAAPTPSFAPAPPLRSGGPPPAKPAKSPLGPPNPADTVAPDQGGGIDTGVHPDFTAQPAPPSPKDTVVKPKFFDQTGSEVGNGVMRGFAELGRAAAFTLGGPAAVGIDKIHSLASGKDETGAQDAAFQAIDQVANAAVDHWKPVDQTKSGLGAQVLGDAAGVVPALTLGPAALPLLSAQAGTNAGIDSINSGQDAKTAGILATTAVVSNALGMKIPLKNPAIWKRIGSSILGNEAISYATQTLTKEILQSRGFQDAADKIDPNDPRSLLSTLAIAIGFGLHRQGGADKKTADANVQNGTKVGEPPPPDPKDTVAPAATVDSNGNVDASNMQPPPPPAKAGGTPSPPPPPPAATAAPNDQGTMPFGHSSNPVKVPDMPAPESAKDLRAQLKDMNDPKTPRTGVLITGDTKTILAGSKDANAAAVTSQLVNAVKQSRTVEVPTGTLILKTKAQADAAAKRLAAGEDPQRVIGDATGAGDGKTPDDTVVVQGQTPGGAVAVEKTVEPAEVPYAKQTIEDQGKTAVVTTPAEAVAKRVAGISAEKNTPAEMGLMTTGDGKQVGVHVEPGAPEGLVRVRQLDAEGEPSDHTVDVPADRVKVSKTEAPAETARKSDKLTEESPKQDATSNGVTTKVETEASEPSAEEAPKPPAVEVAKTEAIPEQTPAEESGVKPTEDTAPSSEPAKKLKAEKPKSGLDVLPAALEAHEAQETIPEGKKFAAPLAERQQNAVDFAAVLKAAADSARGKASVSDIERAQKAAKATDNLADKGKAETEKGQGTGHVKITALVNEMHKAARALLGTAREDDDVQVKPKVAELKAKQAKTAKRVIEEMRAREEAAKAKAAVPEPAKVEVPVNPKYADQVKGRVKVKEQPKPSDVQTQREGQRLMERYVGSEEEGAAKARADVAQWLHEHGEKFGMGAEDHDKILQLMDDKRVEENPDAVRPKRMSDTVGDEESRLDTTPEGLSGMKRGGKELLSLSDDLGVKKDAELRMSIEWRRLANSMDNSGLTDELNRREDTGEHTSAHSLLSVMMHNAGGSPGVKALLMAMRAHMPDLPVYMVSAAKSLKTGTLYKTASGLFSGKERVIQVVKNLADSAKTLRTATHEMLHGATSFEMQHNPNGELARAMGNARDILERRLRSQFGDDLVDQHMNYFQNSEGAVKPEEFHREMYGASDAQEMAAELANPEFLRLVAESEHFASPMEGLDRAEANTPRTLLGKIFHAIGKFFGVDDPRLLAHIASLTEETMKEQGRKMAPGGKLESLDKSSSEHVVDFESKMQERFGLNPMESRAALKPMMEMREEPEPLKHAVERELRSVTDSDEPTIVARMFQHATVSKAVDLARTIKTKLKTVPQIYRDHRADFGREDDPANPLTRLQDVDGAKTKIMHTMGDIVKPVAKAWHALDSDNNLRMSALLRDSTMWKIDPRKDASSQILSVQARDGFDARHTEFQARYAKLSDAAKKVFGDVIESSRKIAKAERRAAVDTALHTFSDTDINDAQRSLLYGAKTAKAYEDMIGPGKLVDVGERNGALKEALKSFGGTDEMAGPYVHLGRHGDYVVHADPEGTKEFANENQARGFADMLSKLSPDSKGTYAFRGGKHVVDYKAFYTSFHESRAEAERAAAEVTKLGLNPGNVTVKTMSEQAPISPAARELVAEAERKINKMGGSDKGTEALSDSLRSAFLQMTAARSAYAGSRLARKNVAGVKAEDMQRNFADHAQSVIWHTAQMRTVFDQASALAKVRGMARDAQSGVSQLTQYRRGEAVSALNAHMADEVKNFGRKGAVNSTLAKLGFATYLASPAHAFIWMTQNFNTGIPWAGARYGYGKSTAAFAKGMKVFGPAFNETMKQVFSGGGDADAVHKAILDYVAKDKDMGKWAGHLQQLIDRGVISHSYSNELATAARSNNSSKIGTGIDRAFDWARLLPNMADSFNRVSTALAGLELTGGDIRKTAEMVDIIHADYSAAAKPLAFKALSRIPGGSSITMFKTYTQSMAHLLYGNLVASFKGPNKMEAAKTVAGMMLANSLLAGVFAGAAIEPLKLAVYAYHKIFDQEGETYDLQNAIHLWLVDHLGKGAGNVAAGGLPRMAGFDLSSRMGLGDLFFHNAPDLLAADGSGWKDFIYDQGGPMVSFVGDRIKSFSQNYQAGNLAGAASDLVPIKAYQDAVKGWQLATTGKQNSMGNTMTAPSYMDAAYQTFGLKPASVATAQEKAGAAINISSKIKTTKESALKAFIADPKQDQSRIEAFNKMHPAEAIKSQDIQGLMRYKQQQASGGPVKDPDINSATNF
jgi:hypothetical protein